MLRDTNAHGSTKMGIREKINDSRLGTIVGIGLLVAAAVILTLYFWPGGPHINYRQSYYSDDDGKTYFEDSIYKFAPWDHNGKTADIAVVYEDAHNNKFVGYLKRYTPDALKQLQNVYTDTSAKGSPAQVQEAVLTLMQSPLIAMSGTEVKLPGSSSSWVPHGRMMYPPIKMPDGGDAATIVPP